MNHYKVYIERDEEINRLHKLLDDSNYLLLLGQHGVGKSSLVRDYLDKFTWKYQKAYLFMSFGPDAEDDLWSGLKEASTDYPNILVIDGLDMDFSDEDCDRLLRFVKKA